MTEFERGNHQKALWRIKQLFRIFLPFKYYFYLIYLIHTCLLSYSESLKRQEWEEVDGWMIWDWMKWGVATGGELVAHLGGWHFRPGMVNRLGNWLSRVFIHKWPYQKRSFQICNYQKRHRYNMYWLDYVMRPNLGAWEPRYGIELPTPEASLIADNLNSAGSNIGAFHGKQFSASTILGFLTCVDRWRY